MSFQILYFNYEHGIFYSKFLFTKQLFLQNNNSLVSDNSIDTHFVEIFKNIVSAHSTFISLVIYTTILRIFSLFSNVHPIQFIHTTTTTTPTIPTILNKYHFIPIINGTVNQKICWKLMQCWSLPASRKGSMKGNINTHNH